MVLLSIDLGSTSFKAAVFDGRLRRLGGGAAALSYRRGSRGEIELPRSTAEAAFRDAIRAALAEAGVRPRALAALAITSQAQTFTVTDAAGRGRLPCISWQDQRARETCRRLERTRVLADAGRHGSFSECLAALMLCQAVHLRRTRRGWLRADDRLLPLPTYLMTRLGGPAAVDDNLAAMSGLYSLPAGGWWPEALRCAGLSAAQLPGVWPVGAICGRTGAAARAWGLCAGIPLLLAGNDQTAGAYGARLEEAEGSLLITLGTALAAYRVCRTPPAAAAGLIRGPYPGGRHYRMGADECGGNLINWAKGVLPGCDTDDAFFAAAGRAAPGCRGLRFHARLPEADSRWEGGRGEPTTDEAARALLETLTARIVRLVRALGRASRPTRVWVAGGGARRPLWVGMLAAALGAPVQPTVADPLLGAARLARDAIKI